MDLIARLCDPVIVMAAGSVMIAEGPMAEIRANAGDHRGLFRRRPQGGTGAMSLLEMHAIHGGYGGANILNGVSIAIDSPEIGVIVGPNGAGKSTTLKAMFGLLTVSGGAIRFDGRDIANLPPERLVPRGPHLRAAGDQRLHLDDGRGESGDGRLHPPRRFPPPDRGGLRLVPAAARQAPPAGRRALRRPAPDGGDRPRADDQAAALLLDEPTAGLSPLYMDEIFERIIAINKAGVGILMVEQNARQALAIAHRASCWRPGSNRFTGTGAELLADPEVAKSFLGGGE